MMMMMMMMVMMTLGVLFGRGLLLLLWWWSLRGGLMLSRLEEMVGDVSSDGDCGERLVVGLWNGIL